MEDLIKTISNVGFPIAVSVYLLVRIESQMQTLGVAITSLTTAIQLLKEKNGG